MIVSIIAKSFNVDSEILLIGVRGISTTKIWKLWDFENETEMLKDFVNYFLKIDDKIIIGYNILKFDIAKLLLNSMGLESFGDFFKKINFSNIVDLFVILTFLNKGVIKGLGSYCSHFNIPNKIINDRDFIKLYDDGKQDEFVNMFSERLEALNTLFLKMWDNTKKGVYGNGAHLF